MSEAQSLKKSKSLQLKDAQEGLAKSQKSMSKEEILQKSWPKKTSDLDLRSRETFFHDFGVIEELGNKLADRGVNLEE